MQEFYLTSGASLETELSDGKMGKAMRVRLQIVPLDEKIESRHSES